MGCKETRIAVLVRACVRHRRTVSTLNHDNCVYSVLKRFSFSCFHQKIADIPACHASHQRDFVPAAFLHLVHQYCILTEKCLLQRIVVNLRHHLRGCQVLIHCKCRAGTQYQDTYCDQCRRGNPSLVTHLFLFHVLSLLYSLKNLVIQLLFRRFHRSQSLF